MQRIPYPVLDETASELQQKCARSRLNFTRMLAGQPDAQISGYNALFGSLFAESSGLAPEIRELVILRVGHLAGCAYEINQHEGFCRAAGLFEGRLDAIASGPEDPRFSARERAVLAFVDEVVRQVRPSDASLAALRAHFSDTQVMTLVLAIGAYMMVARMMETSGVDLDPEGVVFMRPKKPEEKSA